MEALSVHAICEMDFSEVPELPSGGEGSVSPLSTSPMPLKPGMGRFTATLGASIRNQRTGRSVAPECAIDAHEKECGA